MAVVLPAVATAKLQLIYVYVRLTIYTIYVLIVLRGSARSHNMSTLCVPMCAVVYVHHIVYIYVRAIYNVCTSGEVKDQGVHGFQIVVLNSPKYK